MNQFICDNCGGDHETPDCKYQTLTRKYIIKKQSGFSFMYFGGFDRIESDASWTGHWHEAETFDTYNDALKSLGRTDEYDYRVFPEGIYQVDTILVKG